MKEFRIDFDEVVVATTQRWLSLLFQKTGIKKYMHEIYLYTDLAMCLKLRRKVVNDLWSEFYRLNLTAECPLVDGAYAGLLKLNQKGFNIEVITSRSKTNIQQIKDYLAHNKLEFIKKVHCCNAYETEGKRSKSEVFEETNGDYFIEDTFFHAQDVAEKNPSKQVFLLKRKWNQKDLVDTIPKNILPIDDWSEVAEHLLEQAV